MKFATQFEARERISTCNGSPIVIKKKLNYDKKGNMVLVESGKFNLYQDIQSHADSVDINVVLKRFMNGDVAALNRREGYFGDVTNVPTNYADVLNLVANAQETFKTLPAEIREKFDNSAAKFMVAMDDPETFNAIICSGFNAQKKRDDDKTKINDDTNKSADTVTA